MPDEPTAGAAGSDAAVTEVDGGLDSGEAGADHYGTATGGGVGSAGSTSPGVNDGGAGASTGIAQSG